MQSRSLDKRFENKLVLVTGAAKGIGHAVSAEFIKQGASVVMTDLDLKEVSEASDSLNEHALAMKLDVSSEQDWHAVTDALGKQFGQLDVLINNAGVGSYADLESLDLDAWNQTMAINTTSVFLGCKACLPLLKKSSSASITNIASVHSTRANPDSIHYSASKAAVLSLTQSIALHCARKQYPVRCNAIQPGYIKTPMLAQGLAASPDPDQLSKELASRHPLARLGEPQEIADAALFLSSQEAQFITGSTLVVDGGFLIQ